MVLDGHQRQLERVNQRGQGVGDAIQGGLIQGGGGRRVNLTGTSESEVAMLHTFQFIQPIIVKITSYSPYLNKASTKLNRETKPKTLFYPHHGESGYANACRNKQVIGS